MRIHKRGSHAAAVIVTLALCGCGSSSSSPSLSKQQLASKMNAICTKYRAKIAAVPQPADVIQNHTSAARYFDQIAPLYDQAIAEMRVLKPAGDVKAQWDTLVAKFAAVSGVIDQIRTKADHADSTGIALLGRLAPLTSGANLAATNLGATGCSGGSTGG